MIYGKFDSRQADSSQAGGRLRGWNYGRMNKAMVRHVDEVVPVRCPCGESRRILTRADTPNVGLHVTHIVSGDLHAHARTEEIYYILRGEGFMELDGERVELTPGTAIHIPPGVKHRGEGDFEAVIVTCPAFDSEDETVFG